MKPARIRHQFLLDSELSEKLDQLSRSPSTTKSQVVAKAVRAFIDQRGENELDRRYGKRLDRLSRDLDHVRRDAEMILESLALFIRFSITLHAHTPVPDKATQAIAQERFQKFVEQVGRQLASGKRSLRDENTGGGGE
ncbi:MAG: CopG family transcriptional regulator [Mesorhizobium sp.]|uniref:CopG family transcriptional regulator n=1 Tax=Mesorhizobium sp. TaxID=1871066 RepID=UPI000FE6715F|nr:CopG family transcriptional regulator [Mesorhizobium sp.]RWD52308.1 MAG: CopG family transcriptional regulator [Mesorhizobium sp.]RWE61919.1 MAG: CopG family transcriptional regulator [Mesorhizobium sp.]RWF12085.1 MAG: CopG family transcriptional regulator [Mesorhizobium sp.]RWF21828.1 MAG: CopG family transcriptional regulator [Mesorhizobium sp.]